MKAILVVYSLLAVLNTVLADETNAVYITTLDNLYTPARVSDEMPLGKAKHAEVMPEWSPARDFSKGNWGEPENGMQLSLRFEKQIFKNGERIVAIILVRNVTNHVVEYDETHGGFGDGPVSFEVTNLHGELLKQKDDSAQIVINDQTTRGVMPHIQVKFQERLDTRFDFSNGVYSVQAKIKVGDHDDFWHLEFKPTLDADGKFTPRPDANGLVTNVVMSYRPPDSGKVKTLKSAPVNITIKDDLDRK
jgi:hypothetical protein